jgi:hypothetical protein
VRLGRRSTASRAATSRQSSRSPKRVEAVQGGGPSIELINGPFLFGLKDGLALAALALQLSFLQVSESMGNHDSKIVDAASVD